MPRRRYRAANAFLEPIIGEVKRRSFCVFDIESKDGDTQVMGFTRPFLVGFYDAARGPDDGYEEYRNESHLQNRSWERRHCDPGGCIDKLLTRCLTTQYKGYAFYAHNGGSFDFLFLLTWLREHRDEYEFEVVPVQSSIQTIRVWRLPEDPEKPITEKWEFLDSFKLMPMSLDKAAKGFKVATKKQHDLGIHEDDPSWSAYLKADCVALDQVLAKFYALVENYPKDGGLGGEVGMTTPSTSMRLFRRGYLGQEGVPGRIDRYAHWDDCKGAEDETCGGCCHAWVRQGYYGGRTELFETYGTDIHYYDINSSYVASMTEEMPIGKRRVEVFPEPVELGVRTDYDHRWHTQGIAGGFVECTVYVPPECRIPPLPHPDPQTGKLRFPSGQFHGVWSTEELELLSDPAVGGEVRYVRRVTWFEKKAMFARMVMALWVLRDKTLSTFDEALSLLAKLLGNALYGKFGMKHERTSVVFEQDAKYGTCFLCREELEDEPGRDEEGNAKQALCDDCEGSKPASPDAETDVWYQQKRVDAPYIIPHVAAWITSLARVRLWRYLKAAVQGHGPRCSGDGCPGCGRLLYCDTDSCLTDVVLPSSSELGALKDEYPGELLTYEGFQAKVYMIERTSYNTDVERRNALLTLAMKAGPMQPIEEPKVTMKGFPGRALPEDEEARALAGVAPGVHVPIRNRANLERLKKGETLRWRRLERVRTLARSSFRAGPQLTKVSKSFQSPYDKRELQPDGTTRSVVLEEPLGGYPGGKPPKVERASRGVPEDERGLAF